MPLKRIPDIRIGYDDDDDSCYITIHDKVFYIDCSIKGEEPYVAYWNIDGSNHTVLKR